MIRNYLKIGLRNLFKHKVFSFINIAGLALGMAAFLLILQYVSFETSYDNFHEKGDRTYRLQQDRYHEGKLATQWAAGAAGVGKAIKDALPEVESVAKLRGESGVFSYGEKRINIDKLYFATDEFLPMFSYKVIRGKAEGALKEPNTMVITETMAKTYFGSADPLGKVLSYNKEDGYKITAVVADMPVNTHFKFDMLLSFSTIIKSMNEEDRNQLETTFDWDGFYTYITVKPGTNIKQLEKKINQEVRKKTDPEYKERKEGIEFKLQPLRDIHLYSSYMAEAEPNGNGQAVYFLFIIAIFIIVIAWINYINLSTARSIDRAKEVGMRKVLGSFRSQLVVQFLCEALLINLFAIVLAFILVLVALPLFNAVTGKQLDFTLLTQGSFWLAAVGLFAGGTLLAGLYPAFVMSSFKPITVLKGRFTRSKKGTFLRQALVIVQFGASVILMVGTFGVYRQLSFMQKQDLGVAIDRTIVLTGPQVLDTATYRDRLKTFKTELLRTTGITHVVASSEVPGRKVGWNAGGIRLVSSDPSTGKQYRAMGIDHDFVNAYGLRIIKGRNFSEKFPADRNTVLFNEAAVKQIGFNKPEEALDKQIEFWGHQYTIIGVVSNHHQEGLREAYDAHVYRLTPNINGYYSVKLGPNTDPQAILKTTEAAWNKLFPGNPFNYFFLDQRYQDQYNADRQFGRTFSLFAVLAIIVACLGLLGLASYVTTQRTKEIGIRKISGASVPRILVLLTTDFIKPVLLSFIIALPVAWYLLHQWLQNYAFKAGLSPWLFILPGGLVLLTAVVTITTQTLRAASANPVKNLRTE